MKVIHAFATALILMGGAFVGAQEETNTPPIRCRAETTAFDPQSPSRAIGAFQPGTLLRLTGPATAEGLQPVVFTDDRGNETRALCRVADLDTPTTANLKNSPPKDQKNGAATDGTKPPSPSLTTIQPQLFQNDNPFEESATDLAQRLDLHPEASTRHMTSFRSYTPKACAIFGQEPVMVAVYGNPDKVSEVNLVFLNSGDYFGYIEGQDRANTHKEAELRKEERGFREAMRAQEAIFLKNFTDRLGKPSTAMLGMGRTAERVSRWDTEGAALLLSVHEDQYISLRLWPKIMADQRGLMAGLTDEALRKRCLENVATRSNGDTVVEQIPMIDQGPKGYCVPATYERIMRYLGMSADMYALAMAGHTERGGGTYLFAINAAVNSILQRSGRQIREGIPFSSMEVKRWINQGIPLIWDTYVVPEIEELSNAQTEERRNAAPEEWMKMVRKFDPPRNLKLPVVGHVRLVIGYNEKTREIAYSDSWGPRTAERWMTFNAAKSVSQQGALSAITW